MKTSDLENDEFAIAFALQMFGNEQLIKKQNDKCLA